MQLKDFLSDKQLVRELIATILLIVVVVVLRAGALKFVRKQFKVPERMRLQWSVEIRRASFIVLTLGFVVVWASELRALALSVVAIAAALVVATKELIMCFSGSVLRASANVFSVGDRIEVNGIHGDVIDHGLLATTVIEVGPAHQRTGRTIVIPNSMFISHPVINETWTDAYVVHTLLVPLKDEVDWRQAESHLIDSAQEVCSEFVDGARRQMDLKSRQEGVPAISAEPRVMIHLGDQGRVELLVRVPAPARDKRRVEQEILRRYLERQRPSHKHPSDYANMTKDTI